MTETARGTRIIDMEGVAVTVRDQDRALRFYVDKLGFEVRRDVPLAEGGRWIQVAPPAATTTVVLVAVGADAPVGLDTGITFTLDEIESHLVEKVRELVAPLFTVFDFFDLAMTVYEDIVNRFVQGEVS